MPRKQRSNRRNSLRLQSHDYGSPGWYFVTLVVQDRRHLLGEIKQRNMWLNDYGRIVAKTWCHLEKLYDHIGLDAWVVMPNHMHGIICILENDYPRSLRDLQGGRNPSGRDPGGADLSQGRSRPAPTVGRIIGAFKTMSTRQINLLRETEGRRVWQRGYHDRIIRTDRALWNVRRYIHNNPLRWWENQQ